MQSLLHRTLKHVYPNRVDARIRNIISHEILKTAVRHLAGMQGR